MCKVQNPHAVFLTEASIIRKTVTDEYVQKLIFLAWAKEKPYTTKMNWLEVQLLIFVYEYTFKKIYLPFLIMPYNVITLMHDTTHTLFVSASFLLWIQQAAVLIETVLYRICCN